MFTSGHVEREGAKKVRTGPGQEWLLHGPGPPPSANVHRACRPQASRLISHSTTSLNSKYSSPHIRPVLRHHIHLQSHIKSSPLYGKLNPSPQRSLTAALASPTLSSPHDFQETSPVVRAVIAASDPSTSSRYFEHFTFYPQYFIITAPSPLFFPEFHLLRSRALTQKCLWWRPSDAVTPLLRPSQSLANHLVQRGSALEEPRYNGIYTGGTEPTACS
jgi:hypothetical protein